MHTPMQVHWALVHHFSGDPRKELGEHHYNSAAGITVQKWLLDEGLVDRADSTRGTEKLAAYVEHLCKQPLPVSEWVIPSVNPKGGE